MYAACPAACLLLPSSQKLTIRADPNYHTFHKLNQSTWSSRCAYTKRNDARAVIDEEQVGINGFGRIGRIVFRNAYVQALAERLSRS